MSVKSLLNNPAPSWSNINVQSLNSVGGIETSEIITPELKLIPQLVDPVATPDSSTLYYNDVSNKLRVYNRGTAQYEDIQTGTDPADTTIYNGDGTLTGVRTVNTAGFPLSITDGITTQLNISPTKTELNNAAEVNIDSPITKVYGNNLLELLCNNIMTVDSPTINLAQIPPASLTNDKLITRNAATGDVELRDVSTLPAPTITGNANSLAAFDIVGNLADLAPNSYANGSNLFLASAPSLTTFGTCSQNSLISGINGAFSNCNNVCSLVPNFSTHVNATQCLSIGSFAVHNGCAGSVMINDRQAVNNNNNVNDCLKIRMTNGLNLTNNVANANNASSALLQMDSTTGGLIVSRMTTANRLALGAVNGLIVYDINLSSLQIYTSSWEYIRGNALQINFQPVSAITPTANQYLKSVGGTWTPANIFSYISLNPGGNFSNNQYPFYGAQTATENNASILMGRACTITNLQIRLTVAPGVGTSRVFTLRLNGVATAIVATVADANTTVTASGSIVIAAGDYISVLHTTVGGPSNSAGQLVITVQEQ